MGTFPVAPEQLYATLIDPTSCGAYFDGARDDWRGLINAAAQAGTAPAVLPFFGTPYLATSLDLPANVHIWYMPGCRAKAAAGVTVHFRGVVTGSEQSSTVFAGAGTWTFDNAPAIAGGTVNIPISGAVPQATAFGGAGAAGSTGQVSDAGHAHALAAAAGGSLAGTYPNPTIAANVVGAAQLQASAVGTSALAAASVTAAKLASGAATGAALGADVVTTASGLVKLSESLLVGPQSNFLLTAGSQFPVAGYRNLLIRLVARGDLAAPSTNIELQFNTDNGPNYDSMDTRAVGTTVTPTDLTGSTSAFVGEVSCANAPAGAAGCIELWIPLYVLTTFRKAVRYRCGLTIADTTTGHVSRDGYAAWRSTAALTTINLTIGAGNFIAGSICDVYGEP